MRLAQRRVVFRLALEGDSAVQCARLETPSPVGRTAVETRRDTLRSVRLRVRCLLAECTEVDRAAAGGLRRWRAERIPRGSS